MTLLYKVVVEQLQRSEISLRLTLKITDILDGIMRLKTRVEMHANNDVSMLTFLCINCKRTEKFRKFDLENESQSSTSTDSLKFNDPTHRVGLSAGKCTEKPDKAAYALTKDEMQHA